MTESVTISVHFDSNAERLSFSARPERSERSYKIIDIPLDSDDIVASLPGIVGRIVMSAIEQFSKQEFGCEALSNAGGPGLGFDIIFKRATEENDAQAAGAIAMLYLSQSVELADLERLELCEVWLRKARDGGDAESAAFLSESWPEIKKEFVQRIESDPNNDGGQ